jgi:hypothetical protein
VLHIHAIVEECEIVGLLHQINPKTKKPIRKKILYVKSGAVVVVRIQVNDLICVEKFEDVPQLGRFTLRDEGISKFPVSDAINDHFDPCLTLFISYLQTGLPFQMSGFSIGQHMDGTFDIDFRSRAYSCAPGNCREDSCNW